MSYRIVFHVTLYYHMICHSNTSNTIMFIHIIHTFVKKSKRKMSNPLCLTEKLRYRTKSPTAKSPPADASPKNDRRIHDWSEMAIATPKFNGFHWENGGTLGMVSPFKGLLAGIKQLR